jgi:osmoprotectant transport system ATP-binding protein
MDEAIHLGDTIAVMNNGQLVQYAPPDEIIAHPATAFVGDLIGTGERPFRLLSLTPIREAIELGEASGAPISVEASLRDALAELLWSGRSALPVEDNGRRVGRITLTALNRRAARPQ